VPSDIRNWNDISYGIYIHAGQVYCHLGSASKTKLLKRVDGMEFSEKQSMTKGDLARQHKQKKYRPE